MLETERSYVKDLESAVQCFLIPMRRDPDQVPPPLLAHTDVLFGNVEEILAFHKSIFLKVSGLWLCSRTMDTRRLNPYFFVGQIQIPILNRYLGFGFKEIMVDYWKT